MIPAAGFAGLRRTCMTILFPFLDHIRRAQTPPSSLPYLLQSTYL
jgi:hypothetical protein